MSFPYLPLYTDALMGDIRFQALSMEERAVWILILVYLWQSNGKLKDDDKFISRILQTTPEKWHSLKQAFIETGLLHSHENHLYNNRITKEILKNEYLSNVRRENAKKSSRNKKKH